MAQEQIKKPVAKTETEEVTVEAQDVKNEELDQDTADILDEIDDVLEENAEAFVAGFKQKGGQ